MRWVGCHVGPGWLWGRLAPGRPAALPWEMYRLMSLLPEGASFEELVQDYFLAVRGSGLMLSALDTELLTSWAEQGVPFEVVARGIARSAEKALWDARPGEPVLRSLRACQRQVEAEIKKYRERSGGGAERAGASAGALDLGGDAARPAAGLAGAAGRARPELTAAGRPAAGGGARQAPGEPARMDAQEAGVPGAAARPALPRAAPAVARGAGARTEPQGMSSRSRRLARRFRLLALGAARARD